MLELGILLVLLSAAGIVFYFHQRKRLRRVSVERMHDSVLEDEPFEEAERGFIGGSAITRYWWAPWVATLIVAAVLRFVFGLNLLFTGLFALVVGVVGSMLEAMLASKRLMRLEMQLADAIDLIVGSLRSGAGLVESLESAVLEAQKPIKGIFAEMSSRLRLGDNPLDVFSELAYRVPLETFRLFSFTLSVHWEIGGSLAPTLATVGRTIRDRIDLSRRVKSQTMQARASVIAILLITYAVAFIVWRTNPERLEAFISSQIGQGLMAGTMFLQLVGLVWMWKMSDISF